MSEIALAVPPDAVNFWRARLTEHGVICTQPDRQIGGNTETVLRFVGPDGIPLALVATEQAAVRGGWSGGDIPERNAVRGVHSVVLWGRGGGGTGATLVDALGFRVVGSHGDEWNEVGEAVPHPLDRL